MRLLFSLLFLSLGHIITAQTTLFDSDEVIRITLKGDVSALLEDRGDLPENHDISVWYYTEGMSTKELNLKARTRGNFRKSEENCIYPPLMLDFDKDDPELIGTLFEGQNRIKLVTPCQQDRYVVREYMAYKTYSLFTEQSFKVRLVQLVFEDTVNGRETKPMFAILIEDEDKMAERNGMEISAELGTEPQRTDFEAFHRMAVFQYFLGNTDWSIQYRHNIKLMKPDSTSLPVPVPYDFDLSGIVYSPYAKPAEALELLAVQERRYRGFCQGSMVAFEKIFEEFRQKQFEIQNLYTSSAHLDGSYKSWVIRYMAKFYKVINNPKKAEREFLYPCDPRGTGNVVIRGMDD